MTTYANRNISLWLQGALELLLDLLRVTLKSFLWFSQAVIKCIRSLKMFESL